MMFRRREGKKKKMRLRAEVQSDGYLEEDFIPRPKYRGADKSLARPGRKQTTAKEDFDFHISYL
jgi:hypothetical protein